MLKHLRKTLVLATILGAANLVNAQYCTPVYTTGTAAGDYINGVTLNTIVNTGSGAAITGVGYSDFTYLSTDLNIGDTYTMTCNNNPSWSQTYTAWIDYDHDNTFETAEVVGNLSLAASGTGTMTFTVPVSAMSGSTRMRVRCIYPSGLGTPLDPCASTTYGEAEDYTINLLGGAMNDVGVIDITNPTTGPGLGLEDVIVTVRNYGSEPATGFTVSYQVDGGLITAGFYGGTIAPYSTGSWTAPEGWDFSAEGCYDITAWTTLAGDEDPGNDSYTEEVCHTGAVTGTGAVYMLSNTTGGEPWFTTNNSTAMTTVFGAEGTGWHKSYYETAPAATIFTPDNCFVFMEGSDGHANELETYLNANMATIESWVSSGGKLLLNAAPNEGDGMSFGFGGTSLVYSYYTSTASGVGGHPIFSGPYTPAGTSYTGTSFGHARVTGTGLINVIVDAVAPSNVVLAEKTWGGGIVMFGGMTTDNWHDPDPNAANLRANIISYLSCEIVTDCPAPVGLGADAITGTSAHLFWDPSLNSGGYHLSVYKTDETLVLKKKVVGGATDWTVTGLTPGTDYAFHVRSICTGLGMASDISYHYYFTTPARMGDDITNVTLFPNPNNGSFNVALNGYDGQHVAIQIVNALGQMVYNNQVDVTGSSFTHHIALNNPAAGIYQVSMMTAHGVINYQVMITE